MGSARGFFSRLGVGEESTWGTKVAATELILLRSSGVQEQSTPIPAETLTGHASRTFESVGPVVVTGNLESRMAYLPTTLAKPFLPLKHGMGEHAGILYRNVTQEAWVPLRVGASDNVELAQAVTAPSTGSLTVESVRLLLRRVGTLTAGNLAVEIQGDSAGDPDGTPVTNGTSANVVVTSVTTDTFGDWVTFTFATAPTVTGGTAYHVVLTGTYTADASNNIEVGVETVGSGGGFEIFDAAWADSATQNMNARWYTTTFVNAFNVVNDYEGLGLTLAEDKSDAGIFEYSGGKVSSWTLTGSPDTGVLFGMDMIAKQREASPTNTAGILAALNNTNSPIPFTDLTCRLGDQADVLASGDDLSIRSLSLTVNLDMDQVNTNADRFIIEPLNSLRSVEFELVLPRFNTVQYHTWQKDGTKLQMWWQWTDTTNYLTFMFPEVILQPALDAPISGPGPIEITLRGVAYRNTANAVMHVKDELEITLTNV